MQNSFSFLLFDLLLKGLAVVALAWAVCGLWRGASAAQRHAVWAAAFATLLLLPVTRLATPRWAFAPKGGVSLPHGGTTVRFEPSVLKSEPAEGPVVTEPIWRRVNWRRLLIGAWVAGAATVVARRIAGSFQLRRLMKDSTPLDGARVEDAAKEILAENGLAAAIEVRMSKQCPVPLTWGARRPVVLLPTEAVSWPSERLLAALRHEFGHIRRRDWFTRLLSQVACAVYWMNPFVWLAARSLRTAQEQACDDLVLRSGASAVAYATQLVETVRAMDTAPWRSHYALAMAQPSTLEARVRAIVDAERNRTQAGRWVIVASVSCVALLAAGSALAQLQSAISANGPTTKAEAGPFGPSVVISAKFFEVPAGKFLPRPTGGGRLSGVYKEPQTTALFEKIKQAGADILSAPRVTTRSGQAATIQVGKEVSNNTLVLEGGTYILSAPRVATGSGQAATMQVDKEVSNNMVVLGGETWGEVVMLGGNLVLGKVEVVHEGTSGGKPHTILNGEQLDVLPRVHPTGEIELVVTATVSELLPGAREPLDETAFRKHEIKTTITLRSGETALLGGLNKGEEGRELWLTLSAAVLNDLPGNAEGAQPNPEMQPLSVTDTGFGGIIEVKADTAAGKARDIVIESLEFKGATVREGLNVLREKAIEADPEGKGVAIVLKETPGAEPALVSLSLKNIPLFEALRYVAQLAGMELVAQPDALVIQPVDRKEAAPAK